jgi:LmbE family N-acetylglucosaminyl deacetylase
MYSIEIDDRPAGALIRDELVRRGCMAVLLTDVEYYKNFRDGFSINPLIAVGGPGVNALTHELNLALQVDEAYFRKRGRHIVKVDSAAPARALVWGGWAVDTMHAAIEFIQKEHTSCFVQPGGRVDRVIVSPHINDAFVCLGGCLANWQRNGVQTRIVDVFSATNFASFYIAPRNPEQVAAISGFRKVEELANARTVGARMVFLDFPEALLRNDLFGAKELGSVFGAYPTEREFDQAVVEEVEKALPKQEGGEWYFPLGLSEHVDHLLMRDLGIHLLRRARLKSVFLYEDFWPLPSAAARELVGGIRETPQYVTVAARALGLKLAAHWVEVRPAETLDLISTYVSETSDMKEFLLAAKRYFQCSADGKYYVRYWEGVMA